MKVILALIAGGLGDHQGFRQTLPNNTSNQESL